MDTIKMPRRDAKLVAHRGLSGLETENTCAAFVAAGNRDYFGIETDVHCTADGQYILIHDHTTGRVATEDLSVEGSTLAQLRALSLKDKGGEVRGDLQLPTPEEYFRICNRYNKVCVFELKGNFEKTHLQELLAVIERYYDKKQIIFISFSYENLCRARELDDTLSLQFLSGELTDEQLEDMAARRIDVDVYYGFLNAENVARMHELGLVVNCWTCDDPQAAATLCDWGVDYITTNILQYTDED